MVRWEWILSTPNENRDFCFPPGVHPPEASMLAWVHSMCGRPPTAPIAVGGVKKRLHLLFCICTHSTYICKYLCGTPKIVCAAATRYHSAQNEGAQRGENIRCRHTCIVTFCLNGIYHPRAPRLHPALLPVCETIREPIISICGKRGWLPGIVLNTSPSSGYQP